jgi:hypothetical protein
MVTVVAKPQQQGLNNNGSGSMTMAAAQQQCQWLYNNGSGSTTMAAV